MIRHHLLALDLGSKFTLPADFADTPTLYTIVAGSAPAKGETDARNQVRAGDGRLASMREIIARNGGCFVEVVGPVKIIERGMEDDEG
jgi:hypothetical protein